MIQESFWYVAAKLLAVPTVFAQAGNPNGPINNPKPPTTVTLFDPLKDETFNSLIGKLLEGLTALAIPVVTVMIIIGAYHIITSGGNPGKRSKGKDYILWASIGFAILLLADSVQAIITSFLGL